MVKKLDGHWNFTEKLVAFFCAVLFIILAFISIGSILTTSSLNPYDMNKFINENIVIIQDSVLLNVAVIAVFIFLLKFLKGLEKYISIKVVSIVLILYVTVLGIVWVTAAQPIPRGDSQTINQTAQMIINNDYSALQGPQSYYQFYPFQTGFLFICEMFTRLFGIGNYTALAIINVVWLDAAYIALLWITKIVFDNRKTELLTIFLLAACLQPILFCTFIYGNLMGLAFSLWAVLLVLLYFKTNKKRLMLISAVLIAVAILVKENYSIVLIAMCIMLFLHFIKSRRWFSLVAILCVCCISFGVSSAVKYSYEVRANVNIGSGVPQLAWAAMGMEEKGSPMFPGWYNAYNDYVFKIHDENPKAASVEIDRYVKDRLKYFIAHPGYTMQFFANKTLSQWNEPTYESIWLSEAPETQRPLSMIAQEVYYGETNTILNQYFNYYVELIFFGAVAALFFSIKKPHLEFSFIPLIVLGGFLYHLIFEAKSSYILVYFIILIPYAANGFYLIARLKLKRREVLKLKPIQNKD